MTTYRRDRFDGYIAGAGSTSGRRFVVGVWERSPLGAFADVMVAHADGCRELMAPSEQVAEYVSGTYQFDGVTLGDVVVDRSVRDGGERWVVQAGELQLSLAVGGRLLLAAPLLPVRGPLVHPLTARLIDPVARRVMPGVRTSGTAGNGRREHYLAQDLHAVEHIEGTWAGEPVGALADVAPEPNFGFSSTPRRPAVTRVTTFVEVPR